MEHNILTGYMCWVSLNCIVFGLLLPVQQAPVRLKNLLQNILPVSVALAFLRFQKIDFKR